MSATPSPIGVALMGFGTVGRAVAQHLTSGAHPALALRAICTRRVSTSRADAPWVPPHVVWTDRVDDVLRDDVQVMVEVIGGIEPARTWIARALTTGRSVVTANKQVMAAHGPALVAQARARGRALRFEAAVGGVIPVIRGVQEGLAADTLTRITGILNGTANFVLGRMEREGVALADAVADAQARGFAEADPSADLDGLDARAKLVVLAAVGLGAYVTPDVVPAASIRNVQPIDFVHAATIGRAIRQVAWAERGGGARRAITARVTPALVDRHSWLARAAGPRNVVVVTGERSGETVFAGEGAGGAATAVAVVSDVLAVAHAATPPRAWPDAVTHVSAAADQACAHYVRALPDGPVSCTPEAALVHAGLRLQTVLEPSCDAPGGWAGVLDASGAGVLDAALEVWRSGCGVGVTIVRLPLVDS